MSKRPPGRSDHPHPKDPSDTTHDQFVEGSASWPGSWLLVLFPFVLVGLLIFLDRLFL